MNLVTFASLGVSILGKASESARLFGVYRKHYGLAGAVLLEGFGSSVVWKTQLQVLTSDDSQIVSDFRTANQQESNMIAIAGTILAQIAITAFSLTDLNKVHWTSEGCFTVSLVSSIISVYYATKQHRMLGRCLNTDDIKRWIRGNQREPAQKTPEASWYEIPMLPSVAAVLTISAPVALLSVAVYAFLAGLGIYLGFAWKRAFGDSPSDRLAVFITYVVCLSICHSIYALSTMMAAGQADDPEIRPFLEKALHRAVPARPPIHIQLGPLGRSRESTRAAETEMSFLKTERHPGNKSDKATELQRAFREAANFRRDMAVLDDRIALLLEGLGRPDHGMW